MAEGGDSVGSGQKSGGSWRNKIPDISSLYLGSEEVESLLCREHGQEFKYFCTTHMTELCITCRRIEHKHCKTVIGIEEAAENMYSPAHGEKIGRSVKHLTERFKDIKGAVESLKLKLTNKRKIAVDEILNARKDLDTHLDKIVANAIDELDQHLKTSKDNLEEKQEGCTASLFSLSTCSSDFDRIMSVGNKAEKFIVVNRATKQTQQYCDMLLDMYREMSDTNVKFQPNAALTEIVQSLGAVETTSVSDVFTEAKPIYTGEMKLESAHDHVDEPAVVSAYEKLPSGKKIVIDRGNHMIQLYEKSNTFVTESYIPGIYYVQWHDLVFTSNTKALVSSTDGNFFEVTIDDELAVSKKETNYTIFTMTKYGEDILCVLYDGQWQLCVIDKTMTKIIKTILKDDGALFRMIESGTIFLGFNADKNIVYVLGHTGDCYGITLDGQVVFHYQNPENKLYDGLVVDSDGLFIGKREDNEFQVEKLSLCGERQEVCSIFGNSRPLKLVENELVLFQYDNRNIGFYRLLK